MTSNEATLKYFKNVTLLDGETSGDFVFGSSDCNEDGVCDGCDIVRIGESDAEIHPCNFDNVA